MLNSTAKRWCGVDYLLSSSVFCAYQLEITFAENKDWRCFLWICATVANTKRIRE